MGRLQARKRVDLGTLGFDRQPGRQMAGERATSATAEDKRQDDDRSNNFMLCWRMHTRGSLSKGSTAMLSRAIAYKADLYRSLNRRLRLCGEADSRSTEHLQSWRVCT